MAINEKLAKEMEAVDRLVTDLTAVFDDNRAEYLGRAFSRYVNTILENRKLTRPS